MARLPSYRLPELWDELRRQEHKRRIFMQTTVIMTLLKETDALIKCFFFYIFTRGANKLVRPS